MIKLTMTQNVRFWNKIDSTGDCWLYKGNLYKDGYGQFSVYGKQLRAHRVSYALKVMQPGELYVLHKCDCRHCVNPEHLFLGTQKDNIRDMWLKGRAFKPGIRGSEIGNSVLIEEEVTGIKIALGLKIPVVEIARQYKVSISTIYDIRSGKTWSQVCNVSTSIQKLADSTVSLSSSSML